MQQAFYHGAPSFFQSLHLPSTLPVTAADTSSTGYLPFTERRRQRKADEHNALRAVVLSQNMTSDSPWHTANQEKLEFTRQKDAAKKAKKASKKASATSAPMHSMGKRSARRGYVELLPAKSHPRHDHSSDESEEELRRKEEAGPGKVELTIIHLFGKWNKITQPICLLVGLSSRSSTAQARRHRRLSRVALNGLPLTLSRYSQVLSSIMVLIWYLTAFRPRESLDPIEHATPPTVDGVLDPQALAAFILGSKALNLQIPDALNADRGLILGAGTLLYNLPRLHQLYITIKVRSPFCHRRS